MYPLCSQAQSQDLQAPSQDFLARFQGPGMLTSAPGERPLSLNQEWSQDQPISRAAKTKKMSQGGPESLRTHIETMRYPT